MRAVVMLPLALIAGCSSQQAPNNATVGDLSRSALAAKGMRGPEPANSAAAREGRALVERYYALIKQKKFAAARQLWGNGGAAVGGDVAAFAATITPYSVYDPTVGTPTEVKVAGDMQYVNVAVALHVKRRSSKLEADRDGVVMLSRSIDPKHTVAEKREWRIRGIDIRVHR